MTTSTSLLTKPTTILTGFLGAGKTTYLNYLLQANPETRYAIIENEYGEQSIDSDLILRAEDEIVELNNGCLCCTLNENLYDILNTLFDRKAEYDEILIEATGVANPVGLVEPFVTHPAIKNFFPISSVICLVDAELIETHLEETEEAIGQVTFSDVLLINKTDLVSKAHLEKLTQKLANLNPLAKIFEGNKGGYPFIHATGYRDLFFHMFKNDPAAKVHPEKETNFPVKKAHSHHPHVHTGSVVSHTFVFDRAFDYQTLYHQLHAYLVFQSVGLYRMKGVVWVEGSNSAYIIQSVGKRLDFSDKAQDSLEGNRQSRIVFIGKDLQRKGLERLLNRCLV